MKGKHGRRDRKGATQPPESSRPSGLQSLCLGGLAALVVATPMLPTETVLLGGSAMALILLWLLLFLFWTLAGAAAGRLDWHGGPALWALLLFLAWHSVSALVMARYGQPRATFNMLWQWLSFGLAFFLTRLLARTAAEQRALVALMMGVALSFSVLGYYQYFYEHPATRELYLKDPEKVLRDANIVAPPGTPQRAAFENRLFSVEPFATFALANSLAGFLAPWLIVALGAGMTNWSSGDVSRRTITAAILTAALIVGCLLLTKSRSALLASIGGVVLLGIYGRRSGWKPDWRLVAGLAAAAVLFPFIAFVVGGLDSFVLLQASKSMLYRVQYWRATAQMIADSPLFGCGPGNFQQYYTAYKLPEASETIAEPHNFIFEIWATAGTPAILLFVIFLLSLAWQVWRAEKQKGDVEETAEHGDGDNVRAMYVGGLAGVVFAYVACVYLEGYALSPGLILLSLPIAATVVALWHGWVVQGRLPLAVPTIALSVLLVNLLAAGGIGFASVAQSLWIIAALLISGAEQGRNIRTLSRPVAFGLVGLGLVAVAGFTQAGYLPLLNAQAHLAEGDALLMDRQPLRALSAFHKAVKADPYSQDGWERLANLAHEAWLATGDVTYYETFVDAAGKLRTLNPRSSATQAQLGHWWQKAYRHFGDPQYLEKCIEAYRIATQLYPNYNLGHAQLAWALHLAGDDVGAAREAAESLRLDALDPHHEQKLNKQDLYDSPPAVPGQPAPPGPQKAEQVMQQLRTTNEIDN